MKKHLLTFAALVAITSLPASAQLVIGNTYNTGYVGNTAIAPGSPDLNFTIVNAPTGYATPITPVVPTDLPAAWVTSPNAQFISASADQHYPPQPVEGDLPGFYDYQTSFLNNFLIPTSVTITGSYAADNTATIEVDGTSIATGPTPPNSQFSFLTPFSYTFVVAPGAKTTLDFVVENYNTNNSDPANSDGLLNPSGLLVSNLKIAANASPEPSTWAMMFAGLGALLMVKRVRRAVTI